MPTYNYLPGVIDERMETSLYVPFAQLPVEARGLFSIYASAALAHYRSLPPAPACLEISLREDLGCE